MRGATIRKRLLMLVLCLGLLEGNASLRTVHGAEQESADETQEEWILSENITEEKDPGANPEENAEESIETNAAGNAEDGGAAVNPGDNADEIIIEADPEETAEESGIEANLGDNAEDGSAETGQEENSGENSIDGAPLEEGILEDAVSEEGLIEEKELAADTQEAANSMDVVYIGGTAAMNHDGSSPEQALRSDQFQRAMTMVKPGGTVVLCGEVIETGIITKNVNFTGSYEGRRYEKARMRSMSDLFLLLTPEVTRVTFSDLTLTPRDAGNTGNQDADNYIQVQGSNTEIVMDNVKIRRIITESFSTVEVEGTLGVLPLSNVAGTRVVIKNSSFLNFAVAGVELLLDHSTVVSRTENALAIRPYLENNAPAETGTYQLLGNVTLQRGSVLVTDQDMDTLQADSAANELVIYGQTKYLNINGSVAAGTPIQLSWCDTQLRQNAYTVPEQVILTSSGPNQSLSCDRFALKSSSIGLHKRAGTNEIRTGRETVELSGIQSVTGLIYKGTQQKGYSGEPVCITQLDKIDVTKECGPLLYRYRGTGSTGYAASATAPVEAGTYELTVSVDESLPGQQYTGSMTLSFTIGKKQAPDLSGIRLDSKTFQYDGKGHSLALSGTLPAGVTFTYVGNGRTAAGSSTVTVRFQVSASYQNRTVPDKTAVLTITPASLSSQVSMKLAYDHTAYTGKAKTPRAYLNFQGKNLKKGVDYQLTYKNNRSTGTAKVTASGLGNFTGTQSVTFQILTGNQNITGLSSSYTITCYQKKTLRAKAAGRLTFQSSNSRIAEISNTGVVTAKETGRVVITIRAAATSQYKKASKTVILYVRPTKGKILSLTSKQAKRIFVIMERHSTSTGYQIQCSVNKTFTPSETIQIQGLGNNRRTVTTLKSGKRYYVRVRCYRLTSDRTLYGSWSTVRSVLVA